MVILDLFKLYAERSSFFAELFLEHIVLTGMAISVITVIGISVGILITRNDTLANMVISIVNFIYTIPSVALFGILVSISGVGNSSALIALIIYGLLPMIRNTYVGIKEVDELVVESAVAMGSTRKQLLFKIQLPMALPVIMAGFRTMVIMTIALGGIASFIGAGGLGVAIWRGITTNNTLLTLGGSLLVAFLAITTDLVLEIFEKNIRNRILGDVGRIK
ncbi:MAG: ABC transporter permease [Firmicutes bacterium]|jgi:osmoprotectant transport system permease protein|nr:ABC transporter permease [Bacillota bacterium]